MCRRELTGWETAELDKFIHVIGQRPASDSPRVIIGLAQRINAGKRVLMKFKKDIAHLAIDEFKSLRGYLWVHDWPVFQPQTGHVEYVNEIVLMFNDDEWI